MILDVQADVGKTHLRSLHLHYIWKSDCFQKKFILSQSWIWSLAMFVVYNWSSYITPPAIFSSMVIYCPTQTAYEILRARHTTTLPPLSTNTNTKKKQTQTQQKTKTDTGTNVRHQSCILYSSLQKIVPNVWNCNSHKNTLLRLWLRAWKGKQI